MISLKLIKDGIAVEVELPIKDYKKILEWVHYHEEYRKAREDEVTPYKEMIKFYKKRDGLIIGDFGCGEAFLRELSSKHTVHSFDHVAIEKFVMNVISLKPH